MIDAEQLALAINYLKDGIYQADPTQPEPRVAIDLQTAMILNEAAEKHLNYLVSRTVAAPPNTGQHSTKEQ